MGHIAEVDLGCRLSHKTHPLEFLLVVDYLLESLVTVELLGDAAQGTDGGGAFGTEEVFHEVDDDYLEGLGVLLVDEVLLDDHLQHAEQCFYVVRLYVREGGRVYEVDHREIDQVYVAGGELGPTKIGVFKELRKMELLLAESNCEV